MTQRLIPKSFFEENRKRLLDETGEQNVVVLVFSNTQKCRTGDQYYPYRQSSDLFYLTGIEQEETVLLLQRNRGEVKEILFLLVPDKKMEIYLDKKLSFDEAKESSGINTVFPLSDFEGHLERCLKEVVPIYTSFENILETSSEQNQGISITRNVFQKHCQIAYRQAAPLLARLRVRKQPIEIDLLKTSCRLTDEVFKEIITQVQPEMYEYEVDALLQYGFRKRGVAALSFEPIVASGENALRLHYTRKDKRCKEGELLLFDMGCEYRNYCSDCSRTIPVNGKFTERQKECYNAVLNVYQQAKTLFVKGNTIAGVNQQAVELMAAELLGLRLITKEQFENEEERKTRVKQYLPHGITHFVGLDTHDVGSSTTVFEEGMVLTCEPGIYIAEEKIGIRIETMLLVTDDAPFDFFADTCLTVEDIEKAMR